MAIARWKDGKIMETWNTFDLLGMMQQIGAVGPAPHEDTMLALNTVAPPSGDTGRLLPSITTAVDTLRQI